LADRTQAPSGAGYALGNRIALAYRGPRLKLELRTLRARADRLLEVWCLPAHQWIAGLYSENGLEGAVELH
jgi:hypothetical protein